MKYFSIILVLFCLLVIHPTSYAVEIVSGYSNEVSFTTTQTNESVTFAWDAYTDKTGNAIGFRLYVSTTSGVYEEPPAATIANLASTGTTIQIPTAGNYYAVLLAYGNDGIDTTPPTQTISTSSPQAITLDTLTVTGTASDAVGVTGVKFRIGSEPDATHGTACTGTTSWSCSTSGYTSGANTLYVEAYDAAGNYSSGHSITVNYTPDVTAPVMSSPLPSGAQDCTANPKSLTLQVTTDENATCKYSLTNVTYASMSNTYSTTGSTTHTQALSLPCGASYTYYSRCQDSIPNIDSSSATHSFSIAAPPVTQSGAAASGGARH